MVNHGDTASVLEKVKSAAIHTAHHSAKLGEQLCGQEHSRQLSEEAKWKNLLGKVIRVLQRNISNKHVCVSLYTQYMCIIKRTRDLF